MGGEVEVLFAGVPLLPVIGGSGAAQEVKSWVYNHETQTQVNYTYGRLELYWKQ